MFVYMGEANSLGFKLMPLIASLIQDLFLRFKPSMPRVLPVLLQRSILLSRTPYLQATSSYNHRGSSIVPNIYRPASSGTTPNRAFASISTMAPQLDSYFKQYSFLSEIQQ